MSEFTELSPINPIKEIPDEMTDTSIFDEFKKFMETDAPEEMNEEDAAWIEKLFHRITEPITDLFDNSKSGHDTERTVSENASDDVLKEYDISKATEEWHVQDGDNSCAVCSQQFIINEFLNLDMTEEQLCTIAQANDWFDPEQGTSPEDTDNLLELFGIDSHINYEGTFEDIRKTLDNGGRVIAAVDSMVIWVKGVGNYPVYGADHAIEVVGIDDSDPADPQVIINDSGVTDGCGKAVPLNEFMESWIPSGGFMISAYPKE